MKETARAIARRISRDVLGMFPPARMLFVAWRGVTPAARAGIRNVGELLVSVEQLGPPDPPADLYDACAEYGARCGVMPALLAAIAAEMTSFDRAYRAGDRRGIMALPDAAFTPGVELELGDEVHLVAQYLAELGERDGLGPAVVAYCGDRLTAGRVVGVSLLYLARGLELAGTDPAIVRDAIDMLDELAGDSLGEPLGRQLSAGE